MIPIWFFNKRTGKYEEVPYHLMKTFEDGSRGFLGDMNRGSVTYDFSVLDSEERAFVDKYPEYFCVRYNGSERRIIFTPNIGWLTYLMRKLANAHHGPPHLWGYPSWG